MRFRSFVLLVFWIVVLGYTGYGLISAGAVYFQMRTLIEQAFEDATFRQQRSGAMPETATPEYVTDVRASIILGAQRAGLPVDPHNLNVAPARATIRVSLHWSQPVITYHGETVVAIPLWIDREFDIRSPTRRMG
jgi:hypothetical protein